MAGFSVYLKRYTSNGGLGFVVVALWKETYKEGLEINQLEWNVCPTNMLFMPLFIYLFI